MPPVCPRCRSDQFRDSSLRAGDGMRHLLLYTPLHCLECQHRFWVFAPIKPLLLLAAIGALTGFAAWLALDQETPPASQLSNNPQLVRAGQGDAEAQLQLGMRYANGDGVSQNDQEAAKWFALAAGQGLAEAEYQYGLALLRGRGVTQNYKAAFNWIEKPARRGHARAQYTLGELYRYGNGTANDKAHAYLWFYLAAAQGMETAARARDNLEWQLQPEQIKAMQEEAHRISRGTRPRATP